MNSPQPNVLVLPPPPPAPINTVLLSVGGLVLSIAANVTYHSSLSFPHNAPVESIEAFLASFLMCVLAFVVGLRAVTHETKRTQFKHVIDRYTNLTGDRRYLPYVLPVRTQLVTTLFIISMVVSFLIPLFSMIVIPSA